MCGDPWHEEQPRENEHGGKYGNGVIGRRYVMGQVREGPRGGGQLGDIIYEWNGDSHSYYYAPAAPGPLTANYTYNVSDN